MLNSEIAISQKLTILSPLKYIYKKGCRNGYWSVKEYNESLEQNVGVAKSPTRTVNTQTNHLFCSILAYVKLEKFKLKTKLNHFELKLRCISKL